MANFLNVVFTMELAVPNSTLNTTPINDVPATNTFSAVSVYYNPAFQIIIATPTTLPIPPNGSGVAQVAYVKNLDATNYLTLNITSNVAGTGVIELPPGGVWLYFNPSATPGIGVTALTATANGATVSAEVMLAV